MKLKRLVGLMIISMLVLTGCSNNKDQVDIKDVETKGITTEEVVSNLEKDDWIIVDTRSNDAYNGWIEDGLKRGGHIKGATDFSSDWINIKADNKEETLDKALETKGITKDKNIVLYDANDKDSKVVASYLSDKGFENIYTYNVTEYANDESLEMQSYDNYEMLVPAWWIKDVIDKNSTNYKIFEVSWGEESDDYKKGHIPGAVHMNTDDFEEGPIWNRKSDKELEAFATSYGITYDTQVILYGSDQMAAYRAAAILKYMGVEDVRVLNGGYAKWEEAGFDVEKEVNKKQPVDSFGVTVPANKDYIIDMEEAKQMLANPDKNILVDVRSYEEYIGQTPGYSDIDVAGRIPGEKWGKDIFEYRNIDNTMKNKEDILKMWESEGITPEKNLSFFCGTGWRVAEVLWYTNVMGIENASLFDGGWYEWISDPSNEIVTGEPN